MHFRIGFLMVTGLVAALTACGPDYQPPDVKTNPNPTQRYAITVKLVDPPPGIRDITGITDFRPHTACIPTNDPINHTDAVAVLYKRKFTLVRVADNTYRGHIYLDWPVDEDYYGLGVCKWKLRLATALVNYADYTHDVDLRGTVDFPEGSRKWLCPRVEDSKIHTRGCVSPLNKEIEDKFAPSSYKIFVSTTKE